MASNPFVCSYNIITRSYVCIIRTHTHTHTHIHNIILYCKLVGFVQLCHPPARRWIKIIFCESFRPRIARSLSLSRDAVTRVVRHQQLLFAASGREGFFFVVRFTIFFFPYIHYTNTTRRAYTISLLLYIHIILYYCLSVSRCVAPVTIWFTMSCCSSSVRPSAGGPPSTERRCWAANVESTNNAWHPVRILNVSWVHYKTVRYTFSIRNRVPYRSSQSGPVVLPTTSSPPAFRVQFYFYIHITYLLYTNTHNDLSFYF